MSKRIIFIVGPTGVGKSACSIPLALSLQGEIVSCDAMQVYREVNIACDKPSPAVRAQIPHHMLDVASVTEEYNVAEYAKGATAAIEDILARGKTPIVVGGSGMYVNVLLDGIFESTYKDESLRDRLVAEANAKGAAHLHGVLQDKDPHAAAKIHPNDVKRLVRALEVYHLAGQPISQLQQKRDGLWGKYDITFIGLQRERQTMYDLVERRIDQMFQNGLVDEVSRVTQLPLSRTAATLIGIPEVRGYLDGAYDLERASYLLKRNTRHYVKRQLTWFRRDERISWHNADQPLKIA